MKIEILRTTEEDYKVVQNLIRFYIYDMSEYMGWECPETGLFGGCDDQPHYWGRLPEDPSDRWKEGNKGGLVVEAVQIDSDERNVLAPLFADIPVERPFIDSVVEGFCGKAVADYRANPTVAQINIGPFTIFGGNVEHPLAQKLTKDFGSGIVAYSERDWRKLFENVHGERLEVRKRTASTKPARLPRMIG